MWAGSHRLQCRGQRDAAGAEHGAENALGLGSQPIAFALHRQLDLLQRVQVVEDVRPLQLAVPFGLEPILQCLAQQQREE